MSDRDSIKSLDAKEFEVVWKFYTEIGALERHFNQLQNHYRTLASTWLLAAFAAIGFLISQQGLIVSIDVLLSYDRRVVVVVDGCTRPVYVPLSSACDRTYPGRR